MIIPPPPPQHECLLPWQSGGYGSTGLPDRTLTQCEECGLWYQSLPCYESLGPLTTWYRVRWWNREARRRIALAEVGHTPKEQS